MASAELLRYVVMGFAALSLGAVVYFLLQPFFSGERQAGKRIQLVAEARARTGTRKQAAGSQDLSANRRKQVQDTLKELEDRQNAKEKITLRLRIERAGMEIEPRSYWIASIVCGVVVGFLLLILLPNMTPLVAIAGAFGSAFGLPRWTLSFMTKRRYNKFLDEFANAIDVIVRGVKSGLPLNECLNIIARESPEPLKREFVELVEQQRVGVPLNDCFERMMTRMPLPEVKFFAIVVGIQQQAGGNLSEALGNLSGVLRDRKKLAAKVKALSAEAKASAAVLGALPFIVMLMVYFTTPAYISLLWTTKLGQFLLVCAGIWMSIGLGIMKKMINFKY